MKRRWLKLDDIEIYDEFHYQSGDSFEVNVQLDGNTTQYHKDGIEKIKKVLESGSKILPILVYEKLEGGYKLLDGFKRSMAHREREQGLIEAFVCSEEEYMNSREYDLWGKRIRCYKGGLPHETFGLYEGAEQEGTDYAGTTFLYKDDNKPHGLRIEVSECIHVHWGEYGRYRLALGRRDFEELARAIMKI